MQQYRRENASVSAVNYHCIWVPRRRKRVLGGSVKQRLEYPIYDKVLELDCEIISLAIEPEHVHLFLNAPPRLSPAKIMHGIKGYTARVLRQEFPDLLKLPSMWTRSYFVSTTGRVSGDMVQRYIEQQGKT